MRVPYFSIRRILLPGMLGLGVFLPLSGQDLQRYNAHPDEAFFAGNEARRIGDQLLLWQRDTGGWPKNVDMVSPMSDSLRQEVLAQKVRRNDSTTDNGATSQQLVFLAHLYRQTGEGRFRQAFLNGVEYLLSGQYPNGGWPQFWPERRGYQWHITYNDDAMVNTMRLLRDMVRGGVPYDGNLVDEGLRRRLQTAFDKGVECILATQIVVDGEPTIWCQQHDHETLQPAPARAYELPSYCPIESVGILSLLMEIPDPDERVCRSIRGAMKWLDGHRLRGLRVVPFRDAEGLKDARVVEDSLAPDLWARFYDLERAEPFFCDRDGIPRPRLSLIGQERRGGYSWYGSQPARLFPLYEKWQQRHTISAP